nr:hypothetical protein GCM10020093_018060 [Planobispora longispora]
MFLEDDFDEPSGDPDPVAGPDDAAYLIYTSGSTGRPKAVVNSHRGIVNRLAWMQDRFGLTPADVVMQKTPTSFDVSVWEFFWPLTRGAVLLPVRPGGHRDPNHQRDLIKQHGVTTMHFVPSMLALFLEEAGIESCTSLKRVVCSGEELTPRMAARFLERLPGAELHNLYGPTEAAVDVTAWKCEDVEDAPRCRSAGRCRAAGCTCSTSGWSRCPSAFRGTCTSAASRSPAATRAGPA